MSFVKLDRGLLSSSLWIEGDAEQVRVWVYLLLAADQNGMVEETLPAIAYGCKLPTARTEAILEGFAAPDPHSRTPTAEGRRIVIRREPQWAIEVINYASYREKDHGAAARMRRYRERLNVTRNSRNATSTVTQAEAEAEAEQQQQPKKARPSDKGNGRPSTDVDLARFNRAFQATFGRRASLPPDRARVWADRLAAGYPVEFMVGLPVAAQAAGLTKDREVQPEFLLRDGSRSYSRNGETRQGFDWIGACWQRADRLRLTPAQADVLREVEVFDWWAGKGARVAVVAEDKRW